MVQVKFPRKIKWQKVLSEYSYFLSVGSTREGSCADVSKFNYQKQVKKAEAYRVRQQNHIWWMQ